MPREIKTTIAVDGEAAFKRAINEANTSMRNLGTQLTLAQANFKKDGDAMKLMETRSKTLKDEISQQNEIVKALEKAVTDSTKAYGENSDKAEKWQAELNRAKARLVNLQSELTLNEAGLDRNGTAFDNASDKAADFQATLATVGKNISFKTVTEGISGITKGIEDAIKKVFSFAKELREAMSEAGEWADELITQATEYKMDPEELQRWRYASELVDTSVETIWKAQDKVGKKMHEGWKDGKIDMWEMLGIDVKENGDYRNQMDVMWELGEVLKNMAWADGNDIRANAYAMEVFGKSWRELLPLFTAGRQEWEEAKETAVVVSNEHTTSLADFNDAEVAVKNAWDVTKYSFLAEIAPTLTLVTDKVTELLKAFNEWMETEEGKQAMNDLSEAIENLFSGLSDIKFADAINLAKDGIDGIKSVLEWLSEKKNDIYEALKYIAGGFGLLKVSETVLKLLLLRNGLSGLFGGKGGAAVSGTGAAASSGANAVASGAGSALSTAAGFVLQKVVPVAAGVGLVVSDSLNNHGNNDILDENGQLTEEGKNYGYTIGENGDIAKPDAIRYEVEALKKRNALLENLNRLGFQGRNEAEIAKAIGDYARRREKRSAGDSERTGDHGKRRGDRKEDRGLYDADPGYLGPVRNQSEKVDAGAVLSADRREGRRDREGGRGLYDPDSGYLEREIEPERHSEQRRDRDQQRRGGSAEQPAVHNAGRDPAESEIRNDGCTGGRYGSMVG